MLNESSIAKQQGRDFWLPPLTRQVHFIVIRINSTFIATGATSKPTEQILEASDTAEPNAE